MSKRSVNNFASKLGASPVLPKHLIRSSRMQESIENSTKFYRKNIEKQQVLLEQQLSYRKREAERPEVELPSNIITLRNGTRWMFDSQRRVYVNVDTNEEITMDEWAVYTAMLHLDRFNLDYDSGDTKFGIKTILFSATRPDADGVTPIIATPIMYGSSSNVTFTFEWSYTNEVDLTS